jgi:hypothetical protein
MTPDTPPAQNINYSAFDKSLHASKFWLIVGLTGAVSFVTFTAITTIQSWDPQSGTSNVSDRVSMVWFLGSMLLLFGGFLLYAWQVRKSQQATLELFIVENGWQPLLSPSIECVATSLLNAGHDQNISQAFEGSYRGLNFSAAQYEYVTGSGKSQQTHSFINLAFTLAQKYPLIVLDDKQNNFLMFSDLPNRIPNGRQLQLEGNFNKRFRTTVLPGTERDVLQVLTPDFMAELLAQSVKGDIEIEANHLFVIKETDHFTKQATQELFAMADVMIKNLGELKDTWQASSSPETVAAMAQAALAPRTKIVLRPKHVSIVSIVAIAIYIIYIILNSR